MHAAYCQALTIPPKVADRRKCVPYFLIRFSVICWSVGRRPSSLMLRKNSGASGSGEPRKLRLSTARLFTFQRPNSLQRKVILIQKYVIQTNVFICKLLCSVSPGLLYKPHRNQNRTELASFSRKNTVQLTSYWGLKMMNSNKKQIPCHLGYWYILRMEWGGIRWFQPAHSRMS